MIRLFIFLFSMLTCSWAVAEEKIYVLLYDDQPMIGLDELPALGLTVQYLFVDAYETVLNEAKVSVEDNIPKDIDWIKNNQSEVSRITREIIRRFEPDILASMQDKITAVNLSKTYGITSYPAILMIGAPGEYKLLPGELDIAKAFRKFQSIPYENI